MTRRVRLAIDTEKWERAKEYATATNRTPSELVAEALEQIQARYPRRPRIATAALEDRVAELEKVLGIYGIGATGVPAGTSGAISGEG